MHAGELRDRVTLISPGTAAQNRVGQAIVGEHADSTVFAKWRPLSSRDVTQFRQAGLSSEVEVTIRLREDCRPDWIVQRGNDRYSIESVTHDDRRWTILTVKRAGR